MSTTLPTCVERGRGGAVLTSKTFGETQHESSGAAADAEESVGQRGEEVRRGQDDAVAPRPAKALWTAAISSDIRNGLLMKAAAPSSNARV